LDLILIKDISLLVNAIGAGNCFLLSYVYLRRKKKYLQKSSHILSLLFFIIGTIILNTIFTFTEYSKLFHGFEPMINALTFAIAPLLFLYVKSHSHVLQHSCVKSKHLILFHVILMFTIVAVWIPKSNFGTIGNILIKSELMRVLWNVHFLGYLIMIMRDSRKQNISQWQTQRILVWGIASIWFLNLLFYLYSILIKPLPNLVYLNITLMFSGMTFLLFYQKLRVPETKGNKRIKKEKTKKQSSLNLKNNSIRITIQENKYYRDPNLDIRTLSEKLKLPYHELSARINKEYNQNFNKFINSFRIQEVVYALETNQQQSYTIMGLAHRAGFKSASVFYAAFKKEKGTTPTKYIERKS